MHTHVHHPPHKDTKTQWTSHLLQSHPELWGACKSRELAPQTWHFLLHWILWEKSEIHYFPVLHRSMQRPLAGKESKVGDVHVMAAELTLWISRWKREQDQEGAVICIKFLLQRCPESYGSCEGAYQDFRRARGGTRRRVRLTRAWQGDSLVKSLSLVGDIISLRQDLWYTPFRTHQSFLHFVKRAPPGA